ncbi:MAG: hypothetical protein IPH45_20990, partial [Bacteroidales bacterium]|nr:hypothetical protein [Bacteroidales bacterium]
MEVKWGNAPNAAGMTSAAIFDNSAITNTVYAEGTGTITITTAGEYYVGWHGYSDADMYYILVDDIEIKEQLPHDVSTISIDMASLYAVGSVVPQATIKNEGTSIESFPVTMTIGTYSSTQNIVSLAPGTSLPVSFDPWNATVGAYTVNVCTYLTTPVADMYPSNDCKSKAVAVEVLTKFYAYNAYDPTGSVPSGPGYFFKEHPEVFVSLGATTSDEFISAGTWADGTWYGSEYYDAAVPSGGGWYKIDPSGSGMTKIADIAKGFTGITYDHTTNIMYGVDYDDVALTNNLYSIIPTTGVATLIRSVTANDLLINLATDGSGFLYAFGLNAPAQLYKINPVGPSATTVGPIGIAVNYGQDMEYDYDGGKMYAAAYTTLGQLYEVDITTGVCTLVGPFQGGAEITGLAIPYTSGKVLSMKVYLEGLYNGAGMNPAKNEAGDPQWDASVADKVTVELWGNTSGTLYRTLSNVNLSTAGVLTETVTPAPDAGDTYYIYIKNRNHITTSTAIPISFAGSTDYTVNTALDLTTDITKAFAANEKDISGVAVMFAGDVDLSCGADATDMIAVDNDNAAFGVGYIP